MANLLTLNPANAYIFRDLSMVAYKNEVQKSEVANI